MPEVQSRLWSCVVLVAALVVALDTTANAKDSAAYVKDAEQYLAKGNPKAAEIELRNAVQQTPEDPVIRARLAGVYFRLGNFAAAEREAQSARERGGNEADYLTVLAESLLRQYKFGDVLASIQPGDRDPALESKVRTALGSAAAALHDWNKAEAMLRDAVRLDPSAEQPKLQLAQFLNGRKPGEADKLIDEVIDTNPHSSEALQVKGNMLWARGNLDAAKGLFDAVLRLDPENSMARLSRAEINIAQDHFAAADKDLDPLLKASPDHFLANYLRGLELVRQHEYVAADRICDRISAGFEMFPAGYYLQAVTKFGLGHFLQAETILAKYLAHVPKDQRAVRLIARAAMQQHGAPRAIDYLKPLVEKSPADAATLVTLGDAYMADGKPELALRQFERAAALDPENRTIKGELAVAEIDAGRGELGLGQLEQLFASEAGAVIAGPTLVLTELRAGHVDRAGEVAASLIKRDTGNPLYLTLLGAVRVAQQDDPGAEAALRAALATDPGFAPAAADLARLYLASGRAGDAKKVLLELLSRKAGEVSALLGLADIAIAEKKWSEATDAINRARSAAPNDPTPGLKLISLYELRQDWNSAKAVAAELATRFPRDATVVETQGRTAIEAGDTDEAISTYKLAHELAPDSAPILSRYVSLLDEAKYFREARAVLQDAVARAPQNASLKADLIRAEAETDGLDAALSEASRFGKDDPGNSLYDRVSAELYEKAGRGGAAIALLEKAVAGRPSDDDLTIALSRLYRRTGDLASAEAALTRRLVADPMNLPASLGLAELYVTTGRTDAATVIFNHVLAQNPKNVTALLGLADIAIAEKKWLEAADYITRSRAVAPNDVVPELALLNMYAMHQDWKKASMAAAALAEKFPADVDVLSMQARVQIGTGDVEGAISSYRRAHGLAPNSAPILAGYIAALKTAGKFAEAQTVLQAALDRDPQQASLKGELLRVEAEIGGLDAALAKARKFASDDPGNGLYDLVSSELYEKAGRGVEAISLLENAVAAHPSDDSLTIALSRLYRRTGEFAKAQAVLSARLRADPKAFTVHSALALSYLEEKKYDAAMAEYARLVAERPADPSVLNNLAWLYQQEGDLSKAREFARRAVATAPGAPQLDDTLGWILLAQGELDRAMAYLSAASLAAPGNPNIQYHWAVALSRAGRVVDARVTLEKLLHSGVSFADKIDAEKLLEALKRG